jgi:hypothetical protein
MCLLVLVGLIVVLWVFEGFFTAGTMRPAVSHALLVFLAAYCSFQIINHILTVRWAFRTRTVLKDGPQSAGQRQERPEADGSTEPEVE